MGFVNIFIGELGVGWGVPRFCSLLYRPCQCSQQPPQCLYVAVTFHVFSPGAEDSLLRKGSLGHTFILNHNQGTAPVQYNAAGWLRLCRDSPISKNSTMILQDSKRSVDLAACWCAVCQVPWIPAVRELLVKDHHEERITSLSRPGFLELFPFMFPLHEPHFMVYPCLKTRFS